MHKGIIELRKGEGTNTKRGLLLFGVLVLIVAGYKAFGAFTQNKKSNISEAYRNVVNQVSKVTFWRSQKITSHNIVESLGTNEYQRTVLKLLYDFSDKMYDYQFQGTQTVEQFMRSYPKTTEEGAQLSKGVQNKMLKIASDISKVDVPKEVVINGKKYILKDEQKLIKNIKDNYVKGFALTAEGYGFAALYFQNQNINDFHKMKNSFTEADKYLFKAIDDLKTLKYEDLIDNKQ